MQVPWNLRVCKNTFPIILAKLETFFSHPNEFVEKWVHWKLKRSVPAPKWFSPACQSLIQPLLEPFEQNLSQNSPIKRLFQPLGPNQPYVIGKWALFEHFIACERRREDGRKNPKPRNKLPNEQSPNVTVTWKEFLAVPSSFDLHCIVVNSTLPEQVSEQA